MEELEKPVQIKKIGQIRAFRTRNGSRVIVLPTCDVPLEHLIKENWQTPRELGNVRKVGLIKKLKDGTKVNLITKQPERVFTAVAFSPELVNEPGTYLKTEDRWAFPEHNPEDRWIYPDYTRHFHLPEIQTHPKIEAMANLEARILLQLSQHRIPAEIPLAILINPDGRREIIVKKIDFKWHEQHPTQQIEKAEAKVRRIGLTPVDFNPANFQPDENGKFHIIDVNRWKWPPHSDRYHQALLKAIQEATNARTPPRQKKS